MEMTWFGPYNGRAIATELKAGPDPTDRPCRHCEEIITAEDSGVWIWTIDVGDNGNPVAGYEPYHFECHFRQSTASAAHFLKECICFGGGSRHDPPGMSKRDAARLALETYDHLAAAGRLP